MLPIKKRPLPSDNQFAPNPPNQLRVTIAISFPSYYTTPPPSANDEPAAAETLTPQPVINTATPSIPPVASSEPSTPTPPSRPRAVRSEMDGSSEPQTPPPRPTSRPRRPNQRYHSPSPPEDEAHNTLTPSTAATQQPSRDSPPTNEGLATPPHSSMANTPNVPTNTDDQGGDQPPRKRTRKAPSTPTAGVTSSGSGVPHVDPVSLPILQPLRPPNGAPHPSTPDTNVQGPSQPTAERIPLGRANQGNRRSATNSDAADILSNAPRTSAGNPTPNRSETTPQRARQTNRARPLKIDRRKRSSIPENVAGVVATNPSKRQKTTSNQRNRGVASVGSSLRRPTSLPTLSQPRSSKLTTGSNAGNAIRQRPSQTMNKASARGSNRMIGRSTTNAVANTPYIPSRQSTRPNHQRRRVISVGSIAAQRAEPVSAQPVQQQSFRTTSSDRSVQQGMTDSSEEIRPNTPRANQSRTPIAHNPSASPSAQTGPPEPPRVVDNTLPCDICNVRFCNAEAVRRHKRSQHPPENQRNQSASCPKCRAVLKSRQNLARHMKVHEGDANFVCPECNAKFSTERSRTTHRRDMHNIRTAPRGPSTVSYRCSDCDYASNQRTNVTRHFNGIHLKLKPFACPYEGCNIRSTTNANMEAHKASHLNQGDVLEREQEDEVEEGVDPVDETCEPRCDANQDPSDDDGPDGPGCTQGPIPVR